MSAKTLIEILTGTMEYSNTWEIYAEKIDGKFEPESPARFGQSQFENGGVLDDKEFFATNERAQDRIDSISGYTDGTEEERENITDENIREAAESLIEEINEQN